MTAPTDDTTATGATDSGQPIPGSATGSGANTEVDPAEGLYVPVTNLNYIPEGAGIPQGFVPDHPKDDRVLVRIKEALETQGEVSGEDAIDQKIQKLEDEKQTLADSHIDESIDPVTGAPLSTDEEDETVSPTEPDTTEGDTGEVAPSSEVPEENPSKPLF